MNWKREGGQLKMGKREGRYKEEKKGASN